MNYFEKQLENGIKIKACQMPATHSFTIILQINGGMAWEPAGKNGITHLVEHLCFRRCAGASQEDFYYQIESIGVFLRGVTYRDHVLFEITASPKYFKNAVDIIRSLFETNSWTHEDIRLEKEVVYRQLEGYNDYCYKTMVSDFFDNSAAGEPIAGTKRKIERLTRPQLE